MATRSDEFADDARGGRAVQIAAIVLAVLVVLGLLWFLLLRGDDESEPLTAPPPVEEEVEPTPEATSAPDNGPVETFEVFAPKDPFDPLISAATGGGGDGTTATGDTADGAAGTQGTTTDGTGTTTTTTTTTTGGGSGATGGEDVGGHRVRVVDVFNEGRRTRAQVQVDGTVYTVDEGETFAENFQLLSTSGQCATMLFGDDEFTLCEGEEILK